MAQDPTQARGVLFKNEQKTGSQPDYRGNIEFTPEVLSILVDAAKGQNPYKAELAAWIRTGPNGSFLSLSLKKAFVKTGQSASSKSPF